MEKLAVMDFGKPLFGTRKVDLEYCDAIFELSNGSKLVGEVSFPKKSGGVFP